MRPAELAQTCLGWAQAQPGYPPLAGLLRAAGAEVWLVGGAPRDLSQGLEPKDLDLLVSNLSLAQLGELLQTLPGRLDRSRQGLGVLAYLPIPRTRIEIALPRRSRPLGASHSDFLIGFSSHCRIEQELERRDYSCNALAVDLLKGRLADPCSGLLDLEQRRLRKLDSRSRREDAICLLRGLVLVARLGLEADPQTKDQLSGLGALLLEVPPERVFREWERIFSEPFCDRAVELMQELGVLNLLLPELSGEWDFRQRNPHHRLSLGEHSLAVLRRLLPLSHDPDLRLGGLLHDLGKPVVAWEGKDGGGR